MQPISPPAPADRSKRWLMAGLCLAFLAVSIPYTAKVCKEDRDSRSAILRWRNQLLDLGEGVNIYERHHYPNPPIMALLLYPLALLPPQVGSLVWFYVKAGMALMAIHWLLQLVETPGRPFPAWARALAVLFGLRPVLSDLTHGNVNLFILFLLAAALRAFRQQWDRGAGLLLALAIACKVTPALFIPYFAWKRAWQTLAACAAGLVLFLGVLPSCFLGCRENAEDLVSWVEFMVVPYAVRGEVTTEHQNQSLPGVLFRLTTDGASFSEFRGLEYVPVAYHNILSLPRPVATWLLRGVALALVLLTAWACQTPANERRGWRLPAEFALVTLSMLLLSERTWKHHHVTLTLPAAVLLYCLSVTRPGAGLRAYLVGSLVLAALLIAATGTGVPGFGDNLGKLAEVYGAYLAANLVLGAALVVLLRRPPRSPPAETARELQTMKVAIGEETGRSAGTARPSAGASPSAGGVPVARFFQKTLDPSGDSL
jgi:hypothetical protein